MSELEKFLEERSKIPIPSEEVRRIKLLAAELALGVYRELWSSSFGSVYGDMIHASGDLSEYFSIRWGDLLNKKHLQLLRGQGYIEDKTNRKGYRYYELTEYAFGLLETVEPYNLFISYRRLDSSALALLVLARLKEHSLIPFVDMALEPGGKWHADLEERIKACDYFIILVGEDTLSSTMTAKEIQWALTYGKSVIPLWHSGFDIEDEKWKDVPTGVMDAIRQTNAIIVQDESASGYNTAIVELLNRFGITP